MLLGQHSTRLIRGLFKDILLLPQNHLVMWGTSMHKSQCITSIVYLEEISCVVMYYV